jgi:8-oxo-dGTP pyrophosphatase MutT (NUDIX family)
MTTKTDTSYGIIPIRRKEGGWEIFLIHQYSRIGNNTYWTLPKGHPEAGESPQETALRELREETGLVPQKLIDTPNFTIKYSFEHNGTQIDKTVVFYIGIITDGQSVLDQTEVRDGGWFELAAAEQRLDHEVSKRLFREASSFIEKEL